MNFTSIWVRLGLEPSDDERAIKRAYAAKLREVHPEDDPEGFQQLRLAYEQALVLARSGAAADEAPYYSPELFKTASPPRPIETDTPQSGPDSNLDRVKEAFARSAWACGQDESRARSAFNEFIAEFQQKTLIEQADLEQWAIQVLAQAIPNSDDLLDVAIHEFGLQRDDRSADPGTAALLQRARELQTIEQLESPDEPLHRAWKALTRPPGSSAVLRLKCFFTELPFDVLKVRLLQLDGLQGLGRSFNEQAFGWWRNYLQHPRLRWTTLLTTPLCLSICLVLLGYAQDKRSHYLVAAALAGAALSLVAPAFYLYARRLGARLRDEGSPWVTRLTFGWVLAVLLFPVAGAVLVHGAASGFAFGLLNAFAILVVVTATETRENLSFAARFSGFFGSHWPALVVLCLYGISVEPGLVFAFAAVSGFSLVARARGLSTMADLYVRYVRRARGLIGGAFVIAVLALGIWIRALFPDSGGFAQACCASTALFGLSIGAGTDRSAVGSLVARAAWVAMMIVGFSSVPHHDERSAAPTAPVSSWSAPPTVEPVPEAVFGSVFGGKTSGIELQRENPALRQLFQDRWDLAGQNAPQSEFAKGMAEAIDGRIRRQTGSLSSSMLRAYWLLERNIGRELLAKGNVGACMSRMHGVSTLEGLSSPLLSDAAEFRARFAKANYPYDETVQSQSRKIMIPGKIVVAAAAAAGLSENDARQAMAGKGPALNQCRVNVGLLSALASADHRVADPILRQL